MIQPSKKNILSTIGIDLTQNHGDFTINNRDLTINTWDVTHVVWSRPWYPFVQTKVARCSSPKIWFHEYWSIPIWLKKRAYMYV